ncbi:ubiquitin recognition factor in ER-associated degradation protein 1-like isoform X2 [Gordionus sp. m RMFG-2023]
MLFKLTNLKTNRITHCGVLEFVADEGKIYIPYWMMRNILLEEGGFAQVECISLPIATYSKFQPQSVDFLDITNHKALLENALRNFACLTTGDILAIEYNDQIYELCVLETKPGKAVSIIECDMNVEFAAPVGYKEEELPEDEIIEELTEIDQNIEDLKFSAFSGQGSRIDGKNHKIEMFKSNNIVKRGIPDYDFNINKLVFSRGVFKKTENKETNSQNKSFQPFSTEGKKLRTPKY